MALWNYGYYKEILMIETSLPSEMMYRNPNPIWAYRKKALRGFFLGLVTHKSLGIRDTPTSRERGSMEKGRPLSLSSPNNDKHETSICSNVTNVVVYLGRKKNSLLTTYFYVNLTRLCLPLDFQSRP